MKQSEKNHVQSLIENRLDTRELHTALEDYFDPEIMDNNDVEIIAEMIKQEIIKRFS